MSGILTIMFSSYTNLFMFKLILVLLFSKEVNLKFSLSWSTANETGGGETGFNNDMHRVCIVCFVDDITRC